MKFLFYVHGEQAGLGHLVRCKNLIEGIKKISPKTDFVAIVNSSFKEIMPSYVKIIDITGKLDDHIIGMSGRLKKKAFNLMEPIIIAEQPDVLVFDTFFSIEVCTVFSEMHKFLVLRKMYNSELKNFVQEGYNQLFDHVIIPHYEDEFPKSFKLPNATFVGPITRSIVHARSKKKDKIILATAGGGGFEGTSIFIKTCADAFSSLKKRYDNLHFLIQTGPFSHINIHGLDGIELFPYKKKILELFSDSEVVITQGGYNTINELAMLDKKIIIIPKKIPNDDQLERAHYFNKKYKMDVLDSYDSSKLSVLIDKKLGERPRKFSYDINNIYAAELLLALSGKSVIMVLNNPCNNNCCFCNLGQQQMLYDKFVTYSHKKIIFHCNSEMNSDFTKIIESYGSNYLVLKTNARLFSYMGYLESLKHKIDEIWVYYLSKQQHDIITKTKTHHQARAGLKKIISSDINHKVFFIVSSDTLNGLHEVIDECLSLGVKSLVLEFLSESVLIENLNTLDWLIRTTKKLRLFFTFSDYNIKPFNLLEIARLTGAYPLPKKLTLEPTHACNLGCRMCDRQNKLDIQTLSLSMYKHFKMDFSQFDYIYLSGGEPTEYESFENLIELLQATGARLAIQTNGTHPEKINAVAKHNTEIFFSIDGPEKIHDKIRGLDGLFKENINLMKKMQKSNFFFTITTVISPHNINNIIELFKQLKNINITPDIHILTLARNITDLDVNLSLRQLGLSPQDLIVKTGLNEGIQYQDIVVLFQALSKIPNVVLLPTGLLNNCSSFLTKKRRKNKKMICTHLNELRLDSQGNIIPCFIIHKLFWNVIHKPLREQWNSVAFRHFRRELIKNNLLPICETCYRAVDYETYLEKYLKKGVLHMVETK